MRARLIDYDIIPARLAGYDRFFEVSRRETGVFDMPEKAIGFALGSRAGLPIEARKVFLLELADRRIKEATGYRLHEALPSVESLEPRDHDRFLMLRLTLNYTQKDSSFRFNVRRIPHHTLHLGDQNTPYNGSPGHGKLERVELCHAVLQKPWRATDDGDEYFTATTFRQLAYGTPRSYSDNIVGTTPRDWAGFLKFVLERARFARDHGWAAHVKGAVQQRKKPVERVLDDGVSAVRVAMDYMNGLAERHAGIR